MDMRCALALMFVLATPLRGQSLCDEGQPTIPLDPDVKRVIKYNAVAAGHRVQGLASYYSTSLDGTLTANGEHYWNKRLTAAHLTLPLGCWVEVTSVATGKSIRLRVNDRGPYVKKFCIDLSQAAARAIGVDVAEDRTVLIRIIGLPGEKPLPEDALGGIAISSVASK
jgi:rare lipoprotein A